MSKNNKLLVPKAKQAMKGLKNETMKENNISLKAGYHGDMLTSEAGNIGGEIGGPMVRKMIKSFEENLTGNNQNGTGFNKQ